MLDLIKNLAVRERIEDRAAGGGRPRRAAAPSRAGRPSWRRRDAEPGRPGGGERLRPVDPGGARHHARQRAGAPRPVRLRSAAITASAAACSRRSASTSIWARTTSPSAATSAPSVPDGAITDRRAGRTSTEVCRRLSRSCERSGWRASRCSSSRCAIPLRARAPRQRPRAAIDDTDPGREGVPPLEPTARDAASERTAALIREFIERAAAILEDEHPANMITLRGFARWPPMPTFEEVYGLRAGAIAVYPMYRGLARLVGMDILPAGSSWASRSRRCARTGPTTTSSSSTTSTPTAPARTATSRARSDDRGVRRRDRPGHGAEARRADRRPATTARPRRCAATAGTRCRWCWPPAPAGRTRRPSSARTSACAAAWASSRRST